MPANPDSNLKAGCIGTFASLMPVILSVLPFIPFCISLTAEPHMVVKSNGYAARTRHAQDVIHDLADGLSPAKGAGQRKALIGSSLCFHSLTVLKFL